MAISSCLEPSVSPHSALVQQAQQSCGSFGSKSMFEISSPVFQSLPSSHFFSPFSRTSPATRTRSLKSVNSCIRSQHRHGSLQCIAPEVSENFSFAGANGLRRIASIERRFPSMNSLNGGKEFGLSRRKELLARARASISISTAVVGEDDGATTPQPIADLQQQAKRIPLLANWKPPRYVWRSVACLIIAGQVIVRVFTGKIHVRNSIQQLESVGPHSLGVSLLTASFVGMVFTIQFVREFARLGLTRSVGGVLALALARELSPVVTAIILAGRIGSAFAAELGTMQVSEQTDTLRVLRTDPVDYLIVPRVLACCISLPVLTIICFTVGMAASVLLADSVYNVSSNIILESAARALQPWDLISTTIKSVVFGGIISIISCAWGMTTSGGAKGVGESTTSAVVISLVCIFIADFVLSYLFFQGAGDALKAAMG